jgi:hypothetical protein
VKRPAHVRRSMMHLNRVWNRSRWNIRSATIYFPEVSSGELGCWVRQTRIPSTFEHELQTKWAVRAHSAEEAARVRGVLLTDKMS